MHRALGNATTATVSWLLVLGTPCFAQEVQLDFGIQGTTLRSFYDPGAEELEREVRDLLVEHCKSDRYLRYWPVTAPAEEAEEESQATLNVVLRLRDDVLRVELEVRSEFLGGLSDLTTSFSARLAPPAELDRISTLGVPPPARLAELVVSSFEELLKDNLRTVFSTVTHGCPLGRFGHEFAPRLNENHVRFEIVLPIDVTDEKNCLLRTSVFELKCRSSESTDTRLDSRGTGFPAEYPPPEVESQERMLGVTVVLEQLRIGSGSATLLDPQAHGALMLSVVPRYFFLRELNEGAHTCLGEEVSIVP